MVDVASASRSPVDAPMLEARLATHLSALLEWIRSTDPSAWDNASLATQHLTGRSLEAMCFNTCSAVTERLTGDELVTVLDLVARWIEDLALGLDHRELTEIERDVVDRIRRALAET